MGVIPEAVNDQATKDHYKYRIDPVETGLVDYNRLENR